MPPRLAALLLSLVFVAAFALPPSSRADPISVSSSAAPPVTTGQWSVEANLGFIPLRESAYTRRLETFGYQRPDPFLSPEASAHLGLSVVKRITEHLELLASFHTLGSDTWTRHDDTFARTLTWSSYGASVAARLDAPLWQPWSPTAFIPFAEVAAGVAWVSSDLKGPDTAGAYQTTPGRLVGLGGGFLIQRRVVGVQAKVSRLWAPVLESLLGETHDVGGWVYDLGLRLSF